MTHNSAAPVDNVWSAPVFTASPRRRALRTSRKALALTAGIAAVATTATLVYVTRAHDDRSTFCQDYRSLAAVTAGGLGVDSMSAVRTLPGRFHKLAAEGPVAARADSLLLADDMSTLVRTGTGSIDDGTAQAAADRVGAVAEQTCGRSN